MNAQPMIIFYVKDTGTSATFYERALGITPIELSPGFGMFKLNDGAMLGLWNRAGVEPQALAAGGGGELGLHLDSREDVDRRYKAWRDQNIDVIHPPTEMDFGYTCTAADPDGHRLRVFAPAG
jgi:predicted enzyme related to lactoylglutathione lyase